jgi:hypothetical protein
MHTRALLVAEKQHDFVRVALILNYKRQVADLETRLQFEVKHTFVDDEDVVRRQANRAVDLLLAELVDFYDRLEVHERLVVTN